MRRGAARRTKTSRHAPKSGISLGGLAQRLKLPPVGLLSREQKPVALEALDAVSSSALAFRFDPHPTAHPITRAFSLSIYRDRLIDKVYHDALQAAGKWTSTMHTRREMFWSMFSHGPEFPKGLEPQLDPSSLSRPRNYLERALATMDSKRKGKTLSYPPQEDLERYLVTIAVSTGATPVASQLVSLFRASAKHNEPEWRGAGTDYRISLLQLKHSALRQRVSTTSAVTQLRKLLKKIADAEALDFTLLFVHTSLPTGTFKTLLGHQEFIAAFTRYPASIATLMAIVTLTADVEMLNSCDPLVPLIASEAAHAAYVAALLRCGETSKAISMMEKMRSDGLRPSASLLEFVKEHLSSEQHRK